MEMTCRVVPISLRPGAGKPWGGASYEAQSTAACNHGTSSVSVRLGSNFSGAAVLAASSASQQCDRADRSFQCFCVGGRRADNDRSADDESWIADFRARVNFGECAENSAAATVRAPLPDPLLPPETTHWRDFRARLCSSEMGTVGPGHESKGPSDDTPLSNSKLWAHPLSTPEVGCVLVATDKLRRHAFLKEAVVLLLGCDDNEYYGIILNKSMPFPAHRLHGVNQSVLSGLAGCPKYVGGHLFSAPKIHVLSSKNGGSRGFSTLLPGLFVGGDAAVPGLMNSVADGKVSAEELKLYIGQMEWVPSLFFAEVFAFGWWDIVACSSTLFDTAVTGDLWQKLRCLYLAPTAVASSD